MTKKLKANILLMLGTGGLYLLLKAFEVQTPGIAKLMIVLQIITFMAFGIFTINVMIKSLKV